MYEYLSNSALQRKHQDNLEEMERRGGTEESRAAGFRKALASAEEIGRRREYGWMSEECDKNLMYHR